MSKLAFEPVITCPCDQLGIFRKILKLNFLGTDFWKELIDTYFLRNRISLGTEVPNRSVR
jgi:hypothetical protein